MLAFCFCGVAANLASLALLPRGTVSLGASGAVYGLFAVSVLSRLAGGALESSMASPVHYDMLVRAARRTRARALAESRAAPCDFFPAQAPDARNLHR